MANKQLMVIINDRIYTNPEFIEDARRIDAQGHEMYTYELGLQDYPPNFWDKGKLYLVRCFICDSGRGKENYLSAVASGTCAWCGWPNN